MLSETFSFEDFVRNDQTGSGVSRSRALRQAKAWAARSASSSQYRPVIHRGSPLRMAKVRRRR